MKHETVHLGFAVPSGEPVVIPLAHTFVTGQTQLSGKTTTLQALAERSGRRALAFVTKRGEQLDGRRIRPYLPREGDKQIHWRLVETIMAAALGQRNMKWERGAIVNAAKGATTLRQVRDNVGRLREKYKKAFKVEELYMLLGEYLDLVLPEMEALDASEVLDLQPGLNVMHLAGIGTQTQAMVIRAALEYVNDHEKGVLTIFPEAWEFAPRDRGAAAKDEAIAMARKGAVLGNFLLCDSQDIAGVDTAVRQAASVWILGVQRELNELERTLKTIPAGIRRPKPEDIATLELGHFYACWGKHAVKTYVQPVGVADDVAIGVARGLINVRAAGGSAGLKPPKEDAVDREEADTLRQENLRLSRENEELRRRLTALEQRGDVAIPTPVTSETRAASSLRHDPDQADAVARRYAGDALAPDAFISSEEETRYQNFKRRLLAEGVGSGGGVQVQVTPPAKLRRDFQHEEVERLLTRVRTLDPLAKRVLTLTVALEERTTQNAIAERLGRSSTSGGGMKQLRETIGALKDLGFVDVHPKHGVASSLREKISEDLTAYQPAAEELEATYQRVLYELATDGAAAA